MKRRLLATSFAIAAATTPAAAQACAMCGLSPGDTLGHAFNTSVLFMLIGPYLTFALIGGVVAIAWRRSKRSANQAAPKN